MMTGKIKWFDTKKGYGFISADDGNEYFVHYTGVANQVEGQYVKFNIGDEVSFDIMEGKKGPQACNVVVTKEAPVQKTQHKKNHQNKNNK